MLCPQWPPDSIVDPFDVSDSILLFIVHTILVNFMNYRGKETSESPKHLYIFFLVRNCNLSRDFAMFRNTDRILWEALRFCTLDFKIPASNNQVRLKQSSICVLWQFLEDYLYCMKIAKEFIRIFESTFCIKNIYICV